MTTNTAEDIQEGLQTQEPSLYNVIILNDDYTTVDFVITVLMQFFEKTVYQALDIAMATHNTGKGIAGTYTKDIAESKSLVVNQFAQENDFPLTTTIEKAE